MFALNLERLLPLACLQVFRVSESIIPAYEIGEASPFESYLLVVYKGCNALANMGYESVRPDNPLEMGVCLVVMLIQIFLQAYILGDGCAAHYCVVPSCNASYAILTP